MARYSAAYSKLMDRLDEIESIRRLAIEISRKGVAPPHSTRVSALCRSGVVLLCSHIEGYIEELGSTAIARISVKNVRKEKMSLGFRYYLSRDLVDRIAMTEEAIKIGSRVVELINRDSHIWDSGDYFTEPLRADIFVRGFATPKHQHIRQFFGRFGFDAFHHEVAKKLRGDFVACIAMVDHVVDQRNKIAHGDFTISGAPLDLENMMKLVKLYCRVTDEVVCEWFREKGFTIR